MQRISKHINLAACFSPLGYSRAGVNMCNAFS